MLGFIGQKFLDGGFWMWPILGCSILGAAISFERFLVLRNASRVSKENLVRKLNELLMKGQLGNAIRLVSNVKTPITNVVHEGLKSVVNSEDPAVVQTAIDAVALQELPLLERRLGYLATIANVSTLLGLLGTVAGLIEAFDKVASLPPDQKAQALASSIAIAMNTTAFGLIVAIPLLGLHGYLSSIAQTVADDLHEVSVKILNFIISNREKIVPGEAKVG